MTIDEAFLLTVGAIILREIVAGRNWRNLMVLGPFLALSGASILFHLEALRNGTAATGRRLGLAVVIFIMLIGRRIIPSVTRNWLVKNGRTRVPTPVNRFDGLCLGLGAAALLAWALLPGSASRSGLLAAGLLHAVRLSRWPGAAT